MSNVISLAERRNAKIRDRILTFALNGEAVILETRTGLIRADRLICRENAAQIYNSHGESYVVVGYRDIRDVRPGVNAADQRRQRRRATGSCRRMASRAASRVGCSPSRAADSVADRARSSSVTGR